MATHSKEPGDAAYVLSHAKDGICHLILNQPQRGNVLCLPMLEALARCLDEALAQQPRVIVLSAKGALFCGGGDIREFLDSSDQLPELFGRLLDAAAPIILRLASAPCPVISVVSGPIAGAGISLALCADFVLASPQMKLRTAYGTLGLSPDLGTSYFLSRRVGAIVANRWFLLGEAIEAQECLQRGVVDILTQASQLEATAQRLASRLAQGSQGANAATKKLCREAGSRSLESQYALERELILENGARDDVREGLSAFLGKRKPVFHRRLQ